MCNLKKMVLKKIVIILSIIMVASLAVGVSAASIPKVANGEMVFAQLMNGTNNNDNNTSKTLKLEAEKYNYSKGIQKETCSEGGQNIGYINNNDYIGFKNINLDGLSQIKARVASAYVDGKIEVRTDSSKGNLIGTINVKKTDGWQKWQTVSTNIQNVNGTKDIYFVFKGSFGYIMNINWIELVYIQTNNNNLSNTKSSNTPGIANSTNNTQKIILSSVNDFTIISVNGFVPYYKDSNKGALAIDSNNKNNQNKFAAAKTTFNGTSGLFNITINTLTEKDGESTYNVKVNNKLVGTFKNPATLNDYQKAAKTFSNIIINKGDTIQVESNTNKNNKYNDWSRGRWTNIEITSAGNTNNNVKNTNNANNTNNTSNTNNNINANNNTNGKPLVWIFSDMSDKNIKSNNGKPVNDPDDISAMGGYALMSNEFNTLGIVVASTHRSEHKNSSNQGEWAKNYIGKAYKDELANLNKNIGGYQSELPFMQSSIKETSEHFSKSKSYSDLKNYAPVQNLVNQVEKHSDKMNVLIWGSCTEPAIFAKYCESTGKSDLLKKVRFIAHWTNSPLHQGTSKEPWKVANCNEDRDSCEYLKSLAAKGKTEYYECGAIGQHGIVSGAPSGTNYFNQFKNSKLGTIFATGKYESSKVDHSDSATYWVLLGNYGVSLKDINSDGSNSAARETNNEKKFNQNSKKIHDELLRRAKAAANK